MIADEEILVRRREHHHREPVIRVAERREDASADTEVGVPHVRAFDGPGKAQREEAELGWSHERAVMGVSTSCPEGR